MSNKFNPTITEDISLPAQDSWPETKHRFDEDSVWAIRSALASKRPLLIRGEAGVGKSQLARAAAHVLKVPFLYYVVNARCECNDLMFTYDAVARLAKAQVVGMNHNTEDWGQQLAEERFIRPGRLWWAFDWDSARKQAKISCRNPKCEKVQECCPTCAEPSRPNGWEPGKGCVVLIDEIDKAESDLPNGLLESLGNTGFQVPLIGKVVALPEKVEPPLVVVTTNEERELPAAFLRRCLVLQMNLGKTEEEQKTFLTERGQVHFTPAQISDSICEMAIQQLLEDRRNAIYQGPAKPGAAEFLDLLRILVDLYPGNTEEQEKVLKSISKFAFRKNVEDSNL
jgi:MoxR-like ATPase